MICQQLAGFFGLLPGSTLRALLLGRNDVDGQGAYRARDNRIQDLADPKADQDAVNRRSMFAFVTDYVDKAIAGVVGGQDARSGKRSGFRRDRRWDLSPPV
ncbi:hypothetical protein G6F57_021022 [Rhizopus arrhizus]|nr:hypothetical protein G6F22_020570 [Rhizopus arrhizus]KAG1435661.1 hypothetical protein G6F57_021022 [Rhizopus arrhizus]